MVEDKYSLLIPQSHTHCSCNKNRRSAIAEITKSFLALALCSVTMNAVGGITRLVQEILQCVGSFLCLHKHQC